MASLRSSYWCYTCNRFVRVRARDTILCPDCGSEFVEEIDSRRPFRRPNGFPPTSEMYANGSLNSDQDSIPRVRHNWRNAGDRSLFNPVIVLRGPVDGGGGGSEVGGRERGNYELYYDGGDGSGLRPLPTIMSEFFMGLGFDRLLDQLAQLEINGLGGFDHPPASKAAIESLPTIKIGASQVDSHCAVCKEPFEIDIEAREMPCKHIYHSDCILPWLSIRNSCPVCRHELLPGVHGSGRNSPATEPLLGTNNDESVGLTIWRLPGGGFAVGRFTGGRQASEQELPVVYTEMDGGFNSGGAPRRVAWATNGIRARERSRMSRAVSSFFSLFRRRGIGDFPLKIIVVQKPLYRLQGMFGRRSPKSCRLSEVVKGCDPNYKICLDNFTFSLEELLTAAQLRSHGVSIIIRIALVISTLVVALTVPYTPISVYIFIIIVGAVVFYCWHIFSYESIQLTKWPD
ncbi:hypothetical protein F0562_016301 [Nyssa sinensis]|uniref:RING-type E3 ubiquitin transferase n=1 Tax=Nyssa sinensis TaxID=561372 RepID=A0A5J4ZJW4_9ASTE|nr:hypothetical protein F0562_016301 [Nyssa sinensis]